MKKIKPDGSKTIYPSIGLSAGVGGLYEVDKTSSGSVTRTVTYYPAGGAMRINIVGGSNTLYYMVSINSTRRLKDHLGSASVVTNSTGAIVGEQRYYPYGETRITSGTIYTDKLYTGQREMTGLGIYHYGARFYSPKLGRFLSPDSIVPGAANPQAWNRYSYVLGNPLKYTDPSGHTYICGASCEAEYEKPQYTLDDYAATFGVTFTDDGKKKWDWKNKVAALLAVRTVANKLAETTGGSATDAFGAVYGNVNFQWVDGVCGEQTDRCYADAYSFPNTINFYSKWWANANGDILATPAVTTSLVIHELSHAFDSRTRGIFNQDTANKGITTKKGFGITVGGPGQTEVTADLFTNYILGTFTGLGEHDVNLSQFMDDNIATWVNLASTP